MLEVSCRVEVIQRFGHQQVGIGVEVAREHLTLVAQVGFHLKLHIKTVVEAAGAQVAAKLHAHGIVTEVGDMAHHARQNQALTRVGVVQVVAPAMEIRVGKNRLAGHFVKGNVLGRQFWGRGNHHRVAETVRVIDGPLQGLHAAHAATNHRRPALNAQHIG